jgi:hypothetical protein
MDTNDRTLSGFFYPRTATGRASLLPPPPWHYSGDLLTVGAPDALDELVSSGSASFEGGPAWRGDATLELFGSPTEELDRLGVEEIIGGYYRQVGVTWDGGSVLARREIMPEKPTMSGGPETS